jgi:haloalkane dehalogenase
VLITNAARAFCRSWRNQRAITVRGLHFVQQDAPHEIGVALCEFLK